ncbi:MAG TPA: ABC transporter permease [Bryobacteraceae bacterium]|nr:ABC transporter permease [Bryobacteraceae bacterium]
MKQIGMFFAAARLALATIREHKLRSFLTVLGVIIGTATVIGVGSIITGFDGAITSFVRAFGPDAIIVLKFNGDFAADNGPEIRRRKPLSYENARAIEERCPSISYVTAMLQPRWSGINRIRYMGNDMFRINLMGVEESYAATGTTLKLGRFLTDDESRRRAPVVVIGEDIQKSWFPRGDALGRWIEVNGSRVEIVGVLERPAQSMPGQEDLRVLLPYWTLRKFFPSSSEHFIIAHAKEGLIAQAQDEVRAVMRVERRDKPGAPDSFWMSTAQQMIDHFHDVTSMVALVMVVLSSIALLVGGIGVMNIMLVSVTERTREIGIRKAIGARRRDIVAQFLTEATVLTGLGGLLGMAAGWSISAATRVIFPSLPTVVPVWAATLGVAASVGVGLLFGIWPASKAARLDPVVALRYE